MPPEQLSYAGEPRRVGFEIELAGLNATGGAEVVQRCFGGEVHVTEPHRAEVTGTELGDFRVELDVALLTDGKIAGWFGEEAGRPFEELVGDVSSLIAPYEIVTPPVALGDMPRLETLRRELRAAGAVGTSHAALYAFGVHVNPELPSREFADVLAYVRAFAVLQEWLCLTSETDLARRVGRFARPWPSRWIDRVLSPDYEPTLAEFTSDYLAMIGNRNQALDLLPLLAWLDDARRFPALHEDAHVKARPTFHYRLPNCHVGDPSWTIAEEWNRWNEVERLAADRAALERVVRGSFAVETAGPSRGGAA